MVECDNLSLKSKSLSRTPLQKHSQCYLHTSIQYTRQARLTDKKEEDSTSEYFCTKLNIQNVCMTFDVASLYSLPKLTCMCSMFMDRNAQEVFSSQGFLSLSKTALLNIVLKDSFAAPEKDIFLALLTLCKHNSKENHAEIMQAVCLPLMSLTELLNDVRPLGLWSPDAILDAIKVQSESQDMDFNYRGMLIPEESIATMKYGAQVTSDDCRSGIEIKLCQPSISNHIQILLLDRDSRSHSYSIEVSMDELDWIRVIDHSQYLGRSWQKLYLPAHVSRYIQIVGTHNTVNKIFQIVALERMFTNKTFTLEEGLIVPMENVATIADCASVIEGISRSQNTLLNKDTKNYDWDSGYTCHQLGSGTIVVQPAQPYMIRSRWLLLWDCEDQSYSYHVEVSTNQQQWTIVAERTKVACKSWQSVTVERQPASFIRIVGTHNAANEVFHYVHFECPEQQSSQKEENSGDLGTGDTSLASQQLDPHVL
ncbi:hypothetical protein E2I00_018786 [Balaenoptera physalus]|uniref:BACK domain-containing protein n=1 Tax=Balaenoptera physalus TaxID=9770 RepID=A0A6A1Q3U9_BALPH|nr:hypothetical protein E2I00_018786 [Balaenoptera physalus]